MVETSNNSKIVIYETDVGINIDREFVGILIEYEINWKCQNGNLKTKWGNKEWVHLKMIV